MILFSFGLPGRFAEWCDAVCLRLAQHAFATVDLLVADTLDAIALAAIRTGSPHIVVASRLPGGRLRAALAETRAPLLIALEEPRNAVRHLMTAGGHDLQAATRTIANSCATLAVTAGSEAALILHAERDGADPVAAAAAIARHFGLAIGDDAIAAIVADLGPATDDEDGWWDQHDEPARKLVDGAVAAYGAYFAGSELGSLTWEPSLFYLNEEPQNIAPLIRAVNITGRARTLVFGPYLALPPGTWSATIALGFSAEAAEMSYVVEVYGGSRLAHAQLVPGDQRVLAPTLQFLIGDDFDQPLEVRIINERAAFDGKLALGYVALTRANQIRPESQEFFADALAGDRA